jgi:hypothetical protein
MMNIFRILTACFALLFLGLMPSSADTPVATETVLGEHHLETPGSWSHQWAAYLLEEGDEYVVQLNGEPLGPYSSVSQKFSLTPDGEHIAFAAEREGNWYIVVDGEERYSSEGLGWGWYSWTLDLEGRMFAPQSQAVIMQFSSNGDQIAFMEQAGDDQWDINLNGEQGTAYPWVSVNLAFVGDRVLYTAGNDNERSLIYGDEVIGPYEGVWIPKISADGEHFAAIAYVSDTYYLIIDGEPMELTGQVGMLEIAPSGKVAYAVQEDNDWTVYFGATALPGAYDDINHLTISPDEHHIAFWAKKGDVWSVETATDSYQGFDGYYYYEVGGINYAISWSPNGEHLAYFARRGDETILLLDGNVISDVNIPGLALQVYVDDEGNQVGVSMTGGVYIDPAAFTECLLVRDDTNCDPVTASLLGESLVQIDRGDANEVYLVAGERREGPYNDVLSSVFVSDDAAHYTYVVSTPAGQQIVLDGQLMELTYDSIYRAQFVTDDVFAHVGIRDGEIYSAHYDLSN